jgi:hypothetical protein
MLRSFFPEIAGIVIALASSRPAAADLDVLLKSGDVAPDGRVLSEFASPLASSKTKVAFLGVTSAVITESGGTFTTVAKTGDPLPAPLAGTFNAFFDPVINDGGNVAFRASLNPRMPTRALLLLRRRRDGPGGAHRGTSGATGSIGIRPT